MPDPYTHDDVEPRTKEELALLARGQDPRGPPVASGQAAGEEPTAEPRRHIFVQEEDGQPIIEYLPPQYRDDWQGGAAPLPASDQRSRPDSGQATPEPEPLAEGSAGAPTQDPALLAKVRSTGNSDPDRPALKQEYARAFPRALPRPPQAESASGQRPPSSSGGPTTGLMDQYKQQFGPSSRSSATQGSAALPDIPQPEGGPSARDTDLRDEYKRWFT